MSRDLSVGMTTEVQADTIRPVFFYEGEFVSLGVPSFLRLWSGYGEITWDSKLWSGGGNLLEFSQIEETAEPKATGFSVTLSGQPSANIAIALASIRQGKPGKIWLGAMTSAGAIIADPYVIRQGRLDVPSIDDSGEECRITVTYEDRLVALERPNERRYTHEDQQIDYPGDLGFQFVTSLQEQVNTWGAAPKYAQT